MVKTKRTLKVELVYHRPLRSKILMAPIIQLDCSLPHNRVEVAYGLYPLPVKAK
jgi:hypothetical protein